MVEKAHEPASADRGTGVLSGIIGHELNNIAGALQGFTEIALQRAHGNEAVREYLGEMRIAIGRIKALAHDLESLGELDSIRTRVPVGDCIPRLLAGWYIEWECAASTLVDVDPLHARRALEALVQIGGGDPARGSPAGGECRVTELCAAAHCVTCGASLSSNTAGPGGWVEVRVRNNSRALNREALRDPLGSPYAGRMSRRLTLAALVHCAHRAGSHLLIDDAAGTLSLVMPK